MFEPLAADAHRALTALLRTRAHDLPELLPPRLFAATRLAPALLHASLDRAPFDDDPPGILGLRYRPRWSSLTRAFGLPPPRRAQRGRCTIQALFAVPIAGELEVLTLVDPGCSGDELWAIQDRLEGLQHIFGSGDTLVRTAIVHPAQLVNDPLLAARILTFGALVAGRVSPATWTAFEEARRPIAPAIIADLAARAPTPFATLALTLMSCVPNVGPLQAALTMLTGSGSVRALAHPEVFCLRWAALTPSIRPRVEEAARLASSPPNTSIRTLVEGGRALALACAKAIRASQLGGTDRSTRRRWMEALGPGIPRVLRPALATALTIEADNGRLRLDAIRIGRIYEIHLADGTSLGRGKNPAQARIRALGLLTAAADARSRAAQGPLPSFLCELDAYWREIAQQMMKPRDHPARILMVVAGDGARPGPPLDILNRGPVRALEFDGGLAVLLSPSQRPSARLYSADEVIRSILDRSPEGATLEVFAAHGTARPVTARLDRISALLRAPATSLPLAIEAGGRVYLLEAKRTRTLPLARFAARPRIFTPDPDAPDISLATGKRPGVSGHRLHVVECRIMLVDAHAGAILYADGSGAYLREVAPLSEIEQRIEDARMIVRGAHPAAALLVRMSDDLESALRLASQPGRRVDIAVRGALPFIEVEIAGEHFGGAQPLGWRAAAEALLALWPARGGSHLHIAEVTMSGTIDIAEGGFGAHSGAASSTRAMLSNGAYNAASPLLSLYAGSVARRRLRTHLINALDSYRSAASRRREG